MNEPKAKRPRVKAEKPGKAGGKAGGKKGKAGGNAGGAAPRPQIMLQDQRAPAQESGVVMLGVEINGSWIREFEDCISSILDQHTDLQQMHTELQPFDQKECSKCLEEKSNYNFCGNIFLQDLRWRAHASTPVNVALQHLMNLLSSRQLAEEQGVVPCCPAGNLLESKELFPAVQQRMLMNLLSSKVLSPTVQQGALMNLWTVCRCHALLRCRASRPWWRSSTATAPQRILSSQWFLQLKMMDMI